jgi:hypothetical protein
VTLRRFTDRNGTDWEVWEVIPQMADRRQAERRVVPDRREHHRVGARDRRTVARRVRSSSNRIRVTRGFEHGWLCFSAGPQIRRLAPIPSKWTAADSEILEVWAHAASAAWKCSIFAEPSTDSVR